MYVSNEKIKEATNLFEEHNGVMRTSEILGAGIHERVLYYMRDNGYLNVLQRGVYELVNHTQISNPDLVIIGKKIPEARFCLISALSIHDMTDEIPHKVHIALPRMSRDPVLDYPPIQVYRFSEKTINAGVQMVNIDGEDIKVFNAAKTIADCFKFRNQIGLEVAIEALKRGISENKVNYKDVIYYARLNRVARVMRPYLEALGHG